jgi:hypothetical protein
MAYINRQEIKISQLPQAAALQGGEIIPLVQSGQTVQASLNQMATIFFGNLLIDGGSASTPRTSSCFAIDFGNSAQVS